VKFSAINKQLAWTALAIVAGGLAGFVVASTAGQQRAGGPAFPLPGREDSGSAAEPATQQHLEERVATLSLTVDSLSSLLEQEIEERRWLEDEIYALRETLDRAPQAQSTPRQQVAAAQSLPRRSSSQNVSVDAFIEAGFDPLTADSLKKRTDEGVLDRLYLRDQAAREGWLNTAKYYEQRNNLPNAEQPLRQELGETGYDRYLYALGRPNRVSINSVMEGSAAQKAGLEEGDVLYSYDGERLYSRRALSPFTRSGEAGELVSVEVMRNGNRVQVYIPRGPLGVGLSSASIKP